MNYNFVNMLWWGYLQNVHGLYLVDVVVPGVAVDLEHAVNEGQFAERPQIQLLVVLLVLQAGQRLTELVQGADGRDCIRTLTERWDSNNKKKSTMK